MMEWVSLTSRMSIFFVVGRVELRPCAGQGRWRSTALSEGI